MSAKRKSLKGAAASSGGSSGMGASTTKMDTLYVDFMPPDSPGSAPPYIFLSPLEMTARELLPDDPVVVIDLNGGRPLSSGLVWPMPKLDRTRARVPCLPVTPLPLSPLDGTGGAHACAVAAAVDVMPATLYAGQPFSPCLTLYVQRPVEAVGTGAGAPLSSLLSVLLCAVLPPTGGVLEISGTGNASGSAMPNGAVRLRLDPHCRLPGTYGVVTVHTRLVEGPPPHLFPRSVPEKRGDMSPVAGLNEQMDEIRGLIQAAVLHRQNRCGRAALLPPARGALLVGPPGTGKTLLASAMAARLGLVMKVVNGPELLSAVVGESEAALRRAFADASGGLLFIDELDGAAPERGGGGGEVQVRMLATLLTLMDGLQPTGQGTEDDRNRSKCDTVMVIDALQAHARVSARGGYCPVPSGPVFVLAATNRASAVDPALRRPGRFDREIAIPIPSQSARVDIMSACLRSYPHTITDDRIRALAEGMHGYVGADIAAVCREAALVALQRHVRPAPAPVEEAALVPTFPLHVEEAVAALGNLSICDAAAAAPVNGPPLRSAALCITLDDMRRGLRLVQPSSLREIAVEVPTVTWSDIGGQEDVKARLQEAVEWPMSHPAAFTALGIRPPRGVLLYGPPGCSKTMMARAMASSGSMNFISVKGPELLSKYVGDSEKAVAEVFHRARAAAPCVVFFDEFDSLAPRRGGAGGDEGSSGVSVRVVSQLLTELDGVAHLKLVVVVAATNRPDLIDPALLRPGRIDRLLYVGVPDAPARVAIVRARVRAVPHEAALQGVEGGNAIAGLCADRGTLDGYSGAEIVGIMREAALLAVNEHTIRRVRAGVTTEAVPQQQHAAELAVRLELRVAHVMQAAAAMPRGVTPAMLAFYDTFRRS